MKFNLLTSEYAQSMAPFHRPFTMAWLHKGMRAYKLKTIMATTLKDVEGEVPNTQFFHSTCERKVRVSVAVLKVTLLLYISLQLLKVVPPEYNTNGSKS